MGDKDAKGSQQSTVKHLGIITQAVAEGNITPAQGAKLAEHYLGEQRAAESGKG